LSNSCRKIHEVIAPRSDHPRGLIEENFRNATGTTVKVHADSPAILVRFVVNVRIPKKTKLVIAELNSLIQMMLLVGFSELKRCIIL
jgi:hypothetical protein